MLIHARKLRVIRKKINKRVMPFVTFISLVVLAEAGLFLLSNLFENNQVILQLPIVIKEKELINPIPEIDFIKSNQKTATHGAELEIIKRVQAVEIDEDHIIRGQASYYSRAGCLGCSENLTMANGETLDDSALTLALTPQVVRQFNLLNAIVIVRNAQTGQEVAAKVTDTGGFGHYNRVADLSVATRDAINCTNLCQVIISY